MSSLSGSPGCHSAQSPEPREGRCTEAAAQPPRGQSEEPGEAPGGEAGGRDHQAGEGTPTDVLLSQGSYPVSRSSLEEILSRHVTTCHIYQEQCFHIIYHFLLVCLPSNMIIL